MSGTKNVPQGLIREMNAIQKKLNEDYKDGLVPRGVYRFRSFEEADEQMEKWLRTRQIAEEKRKKP